MTEHEELAQAICNELWAGRKALESLNRGKSNLDTSLRVSGGSYSLIRAQLASATVELRRIADALEEMARK